MDVDVACSCGSGIVLTKRCKTMMSHHGRYAVILGTTYFS